MVWCRASTADSDSDMDEAELELMNETQRDQNDESNSTKIAANLNLTTQQQQLKQWANEESSAADMTTTGTGRQRGHVSSLSVGITVCLSGLKSNGPSLSFTFVIQGLATALSLLRSPPLWRPRRILRTVGNIGTPASILN